MTDNAFAKFIDCPAHPDGKVHWWDPRKHKAILFCQGGQWEGIWECPRTGESDEHDHYPHLEVETVEVTYWSTPDIDSSYNTEVYVCGGAGGCGHQLSPDEASPAEDRAEALADMQIMEALGK